MESKNELLDLINEKIVVTAEIGINHNGDLKLAEGMIDAAAKAGADAVKFQAFKTDFMYSQLTPGFKHTENDVFAQMKGLEIQDSWWPGLKERAHQQGLLFSASVFDRPSMELLTETGVDFLKIASGEMTNHDFLKEQKVLSDTYVVSTGMAVLEEIAATVHFLKQSGINKIILLECTSSYPAPPDSIYLLNIDYLRDTFQLPVGFSDHTLGMHHAIASAARGARFIEKHFTLDRNMEGPDQKISCDPSQLRLMVDAIKEINISLQANQKMFFSKHEENSRDIGRKSVTANRKIEKGERITKENTIIKRPGKGVAPPEAKYLYGRTAKQEIPQDQWITWDLV